MAKPSQDSQLLVLSCVSTVPAVGGVTVVGPGLFFGEAWGLCTAGRCWGWRALVEVSTGFRHEQSWSVRTLRLE